MKAPAVLLLFASLCFAQAGKVELFGVVTDPSGLAVSKARVVAEEQSTSARVETTTGSRGEYHLLGLSVGDYELNVEQSGFRTWKQTGLTLRLADQIELNIRLELGQQSQSVEVNSAAPLLQTALGAVTYNVDEHKITTLPLDGRNFIPLVALSPGVALPGGGSLLPHQRQPPTHQRISL